MKKKDIRIITSKRALARDPWETERPVRVGFRKWGVERWSTMTKCRNIERREERKVESKRRKKVNQS